MCVCVMGMKVNHWLLLVRMAVLIGQRDHTSCVVGAEEDGQHKIGMSTNENLSVVVAECSQNFTHAIDP